MLPPKVLLLWAIEREPERVDDGHNSRHWKAQTASGLVALRLYGPDTSPADATHEHQVLVALAQCGVPVPRPIPSTTGNTLVRHGGRLWSAFEWIDGTPLRGGDDEAAARVGATLAQAHSCTSARRGGHTFSPLVKFADTPRWGGLSLRAALTTYDDHDPIRAPLLRSALGRMDDLLGPHRTALSQNLVLTHGDLHPGNVRATPDGGLIILDWAFAHLDHPVADLGVAYRLWGPAFASLLEGYSSAGLLAQDQRRLIPVLAAARGLDHLADRLTRWAAHRGPDPANEVDRELADIGTRIVALREQA